MARMHPAIWKGLAALIGALVMSGIGAVGAAQPPPVSPLPLPPALPAINNNNNNNITINQPPIFLQRQSIFLGGPNVTTYVQRDTRLIDNDAKRMYVLLSPGGRGYSGRRFVRQADGTFRIQSDRPVQDDKNTTSAVSSAGLLVVLPPGDGDGLQCVSFWADVMKNVLKGRYYVALAVAPRWEGPQLATWLTDSNVKQVKDARFSTEGLAADIARDVSSLYHIDPQRVFLHGGAESGIAAYACSLHNPTPFKGFYIHGAPFRAAQLPALAHAHGRRYYLQQSQDDRTEPLWMADVARKLLTDQGAMVKMTTYHGNGAYISGDKSWEDMSDAIAWLEAGAQPAKTKKI